MRVVVEEYKQEWAIQFENIKEELEQILIGIPYITIEHVGNTSVPGLAAKPVIDISIISKRTDVEAAIQALTAKGGYAYMGEWHPGRTRFSKTWRHPNSESVCVS